MKQILIALFTLTPFIVQSQITNGNDTIFKINNETIVCNIIKTSDTEISFSYPGETLENTITTNMILMVHFSSGRIQILNEKILIHGEQDWEKVIITKNNDDVTGLIRKGEVKAKISTTAWGTFSNMEKITDKAYNKMKKQAAKLGAHIILSHGDMGEHRGNSVITGIAYAYE